jgi:hypothetical protein
MKTLLFGAVAMLLVAGCAAPPYTGTQAMGTVSGHVYSWPCAPVEIAGSPCPGKPAAGIELDFARGSNQLGTAVTDGGGRYSIDLLPGTYTVALQKVRTIQSPSQVTVVAGQVTNADFTFDNGIR